jgi:hypothetical protein
VIWRAAALAALLALATGCSQTRSESVSVERTRGVQAGQPTDLTTIRQEQAQSESALDVGPAVQAAVSAAMGDVRGALSALSGTVKGLSDRPAPPSAAEVQTMLAAVGESSGLSAETAGAVGGAGGLALLALREWMAHRRTQRDADEAWDDIKSRSSPRLEGRDDHA